MLTQLCSRQQQLPRFQGKQGSVTFRKKGLTKTAHHSQIQRLKPNNYFSQIQCLYPQNMCIYPLHTHISVYLYMYTHILYNMYIYICAYYVYILYIYVLYVHIIALYIYIYTYVCAYVYIYIYIYLFMHVYVHTHILIDLYIHTCMIGIAKSNEDTLPLVAIGI